MGHPAVVSAFCIDLHTELLRSHARARQFWSASPCRTDFPSFKSAALTCSLANVIHSWIKYKRHFTHNDMMTTMEEEPKLQKKTTTKKTDKVGRFFEQDATINYSNTQKSCVSTYCTFQKLWYNSVLLSSVQRVVQRSKRRTWTVMTRHAQVDVTAVISVSVSPVLSTPSIPQRVQFRL